MQTLCQALHGGLLLSTEMLRGTVVLFPFRGLHGPSLCAGGCGGGVGTLGTISLWLSHPLTSCWVSPRKTLVGCQWAKREGGLVFSLSVSQLQGQLLAMVPFLGHCTCLVGALLLVRGCLSSPVGPLTLPPPGEIVLSLTFHEVHSHLVFLVPIWHCLGGSCQVLLLWVSEEEAEA